MVSAGKWNGTWQEYALADESSLVGHSKLQLARCRSAGMQRAHDMDLTCADVTLRWTTVYEFCVAADGARQP